MNDAEEPKPTLTDQLAEASRRIAALEAALAQQTRVQEALRKELVRLRPLLDVYQRDRKLVAYEIHDGFVQPLTGSLMSFQAAREILRGRGPEVVPEAFDEALELLRESLNEARRLMAGLRPAVLEQFGLVSAIANVAEDRRRREGVRIDYDHRGQFERLPPPLETALFRIVEEALTNACRHSKSDQIRIGLYQEGNRLRAQVEDWGIGFQPENVEEDRLGLKGIRERARLFGGQATIDAAPGRGARISVELPLGGPLPEDARDRQP